MKAFRYNWLISICCLWTLSSLGADQCGPDQVGTWSEKSSWTEGSRVYAVGVSNPHPNVSDARFEALEKAEAELRKAVGADDDEVLEPKTHRTVDCPSGPNQHISMRLVSLDVFHQRKRRERSPANLPASDNSASISSEAPPNSSGFLMAVRVGVSPVQGSADSVAEVGLGIDERLVNGSSLRITLDFPMSLHRDATGTSEILGGIALSGGFQARIYKLFYVRPETSFGWLRLHSPTLATAVPFYAVSAGITLGLGDRVSLPGGTAIKQRSSGGALDFGINFRKVIPLSSPIATKGMVVSAVLGFVFY